MKKPYNLKKKKTKKPVSADFIVAIIAPKDTKVKAYVHHNR